MRVYYIEEETGQEKAVSGVEGVEYVNGRFEITYADGTGFMIEADRFVRAGDDGAEMGGRSGGGLGFGLGGGL